MRALLHLFRRRRRAEEDFSAEVRAHLALEADRLVDEGLAPADAALEARRRFGNVTRAAEDYHERRRLPLLESAATHLRRAARRLVRAPLFAATVVLTLMLGIGATTAVFSLVDAVLLRPLPFADPDRLVDLAHAITIRGVAHIDQSDATYLYYRAENRVFTGVGAYVPMAVNFAVAPAAGTGAPEAERVAAARASASLFGVLGVAPLRGRAFEEPEDRPGAAPVVIIGAQLWKSRFNADDATIGRAIVIDGISRRVIGVMPESFGFPSAATAIWVPIGIDPAKTESANFPFRAVARLRAGVTTAAAAADLQRLLPHVPEAYPGRLTLTGITSIRMTAEVKPLREMVVGDVSRSLWVVLGAAAFLLLIACANVANLFLVRADQRQHDIVVRRALGAGRGAIVAEFLSEGLILAAGGGLLGLALAAAVTRALTTQGAAFAIPRLEGVGISGPVLSVTAGATLLAAIVMSVLPALGAGRADAAMAFVRAGRGITAGRSRHRARRAFVVVQLALALILVAGAGLMVRSFRALRSVQPGFDAGDAWTFRVALPDATYPATEDAVALVQRALDAIVALPGVQAAGVMAKLPLDDESRRDTAVFVEDRPLGMGVMPSLHQVTYASPGAFAALGIPLIEGRTFERPEPSRAPLEVVVTHALARRYWGDSLAVGRRLRVAPRGPVFTVVGVTGDVRGTRIENAPDEIVYLPLVTAPGNATDNGEPAATRYVPRQLAIVVRGRDVAAAVARTLHDLAPLVPLYAVRPMREVVARATARTTFTLRLLSVASAAALIIGAVGLYGVMSFMVSLRARDMAVRVALGARPAALRWAVLRQGAVVAALGIALGLAGAAVLMRFLSSLLFSVAPTDAAALVGAAVLLSVVAIGASWLPARRAASVDPAEVLRSD